MFINLADDVHVRPEHVSAIIRRRYKREHSQGIVNYGYEVEVQVMGATVHIANFIGTWQVDGQPENEAKLKRAADRSQAWKDELMRQIEEQKS